MQADNIKEFTVEVRKQEEGGYSGRCIELPAAISQGETLDELKENMTEAIQLVLDYLEDKKKELREKNNNNILTIEVPVR